MGNWTSSAASKNSVDHQAKTQLTINDLDDYSLGIILNKLPYIERTRVESVCKRWSAVSQGNWYNYSKHLRIGEDTGNFLPSYDNTVKQENILEKILQRSGPYLEEITFKQNSSFCGRFARGTIKWIAEFCPNLKRLNTGCLKLNKDDWVACSNLDALSFTFAKEEGEDLGVLFRNNKRLRRLSIYGSYWLGASDFDHLNPGQLEFLQIDYCPYFVFTAGIADKLAESLVELRYSTLYFPPNLQNLGKLKNLRSLHLKLAIELLELEFIAEISRSFRKLECLLLAICTCHPYEHYVFVPLFDLLHLRRLVIILSGNEMPRQERDMLLLRGPHLEFFVIERCAKCKYGKLSSLNPCYRHRSDFLM